MQTPVMSVESETEEELTKSDSDDDCPLSSLKNNAGKGDSEEEKTKAKRPKTAIHQTRWRKKAMSQEYNFYQKST